MTRPHNEPQPPEGGGHDQQAQAQRSRLDRVLDVIDVGLQRSAEPILGPPVEGGAHQPGDACGRCGRTFVANPDGGWPTGPDPCWGELPGVAYACCGHGTEPGYIYFRNGVTIRLDLMAVEVGDETVVIDHPAFAEIRTGQVRP